jgi:hypothetical protein
VHFKEMLSIVAALVAAVVLVSSSGAGTAASKRAPRIDVSTRAAVVHYLRSIHMNPKGVVIQRGLRNYAGAHCPGKGWACAGTRHAVVQIAKPGGVNRFVCGTAKCAVVQFGGASRGLRRFTASGAPKPPPPPNTALCVKTTGITQSCVINQPNATGTNKAVVWMVTPKLTGLTQSSTYTASITQGPDSATGSSNDNLACVTQAVSITGSTTSSGSVTVTNDSHQSVTINQNSKTGNNTVQGAVKGGTTKNPTYDCNPDATQPLTQDESLISFVTAKGSITQKQDTATTGSANVVVDIEQNQGSAFKCTTGPLVCPSSGTNNAAFTQSSDMEAVANTPKGPVIQTQSSDVPNPPYSGIVGTINQDSSNTSTAHATQKETQCEDAVNVPTIPATCDTDHTDTVPSYSITQTQYGPLGVFTPARQHSGRVPFAHKGYGQSQQTGNTGNQFFLTQTSKQDTDGGPHATQKNIIVGDCTSGTVLGCQAGQTATLNGLGIEDGYTSPTISNLNISCTNGSGTCTATPPPTPTFVSGPSSPHSSASAAFNFTDPATGGVHFLCKIDGTPQTCSSGVAFFQGYGSHTFQVAAADSHGNVSAYVPTTPFTWTNVPPDPTIQTNPSNPATYGTSSFTFSDVESPVHFQCQIDSQAPTPCNSGSITYSGATVIPSGAHTFSVTAYDTTDTVHSVNAATYPWVITPPNPTISTGPGAQTTSTDATFTFADADTTVLFKCNLDDAGYTDCPSTNPTYSGLSHGPHTLVVKATDSSGTYDSTGTATYNWEVIPYLTFEVSDPLFAFAGWSGAPGLSPIHLTVGSDPDTYAQFTIHDSASLAVSALAEPTFTTDIFSGGSPRYEIDFSSGDYAFGYPAQQGWGTASWDLNCGQVGCVPMSNVTWSAIQGAETGQTVTDALIEADGGQSAGTTDAITDFNFDGYDLSFFTN